MDYQLLTDKDKNDLLRQRVLQLEAEHYKLELLIVECTDPDKSAELVAQQSRLEAAIAVHTREPAVEVAGSDIT
jgi:hypothetical protein